MKIPFDIKYKSQIESGEYKVETRDRRPVRIVSWDFLSEKPIIGLIGMGFNNGETIATYYKQGRVTTAHDDCADLFLVTPEKELTEFEDGLRQICEDAVKEAVVSPYRTSEDFAKRHSAELLSLAIDARAKELSNSLKQSKLDKDGIPYHLIEFMCNLYTCQNWKEIEDTAELYVSRIKAAALKDLPRWKKATDKKRLNDRAIVLAGENDLLCTNFTVEGDYYLFFSELEKLPKED